MLSVPCEVDLVTQEFWCTIQPVCVDVKFSTLVAGRITYCKPWLKKGLFFFFDANKKTTFVASGDCWQWLILPCQMGLVRVCISFLILSVFNKFFLYF